MDPRNSDESSQSRASDDWVSTDRSTADANSDSPSQIRKSPLILLPGVGGDSRLFSAQRIAFPELVLPRWIEPMPRESLVEYAARFAKVIDPGCPCFVGGVSFGGVVALEVATHLQTRECYLFGSIRDSRELPKRLQFFRSISDLIMIPKWVSPFALAYGGRWFNSVARGMMHQLKDADSRFLRWAAGAILKWKPSPGVSQVRVVQIHGDRDWVFPLRRIVADKTIIGAGHLMSLTHADQVNEYVRQRMNEAPELPANDANARE